MDILLFGFTVFLLILTAFAAAVSGRLWKGGLLGIIAVTYVRLIPHLGTDVRTFEDDYYWFLITEGIFETGRIKVTNDIIEIYPFSEERIIYFIYNSLNVIISGVTGINDFQALRLYFPLVFAIVMFFSLFILYRYFLNDMFALVATITYLLIFPILRIGLLYNQRQASAAYFFVLFATILYIESGRSRFKYIAALFALLLPFTYFFQPIVIGVILLGYFFLTSQARLLNVAQKHISMPLVVVVSLFISVYLLLNVYPRFISTLLGYFAQPGTERIGGFFSVASSGPHRQIKAVGSNTALDLIQRISALTFGGGAALGTVLLWRKSNKAVHIGVWGISTLLVLPPFLFAQLGLNQYFTFIYLPAVAMTLLLIQEYRPSPNSRLGSAKTALVLICLALLLTGNVLAAAPPSKVDHNANIKSDGYYEIKPIGDEYITTGNWIQSYNSHIRICTTRTLKASVFYYGRQHTPPCSLENEESAVLEQHRIMFDSARIYQPPPTRNKVYTTGRIVLSTPANQ